MEGEEHPLDLPLYCSYLIQLMQVLLLHSVEYSHAQDMVYHWLLNEWKRQNFDLLDNCNSSTQVFPSEITTSLLVISNVTIEGTATL